MSISLPRCRRPALPFFVAAALAVSALVSTGCDDGDTILGAPIHRAEFFSRTFQVRDIYESMRGPSRKRPLDMNRDARPNELIWITSARMEAVDMEGKTFEDQENLCHAQIRSPYMGPQWAKHNRELYGGTRFLPAKWFTIVAGQLQIDFPEGFGIPMYSTEALQADTMILNLDPNFEPFDFRVRTQLEYVYDSDLGRPMQALGRTGVQSLVLIAHDHSDHAGHDHEHDGAEGCALDEDDLASTSVAKPAGEEPVIGQEDGQEAVMHWMVPPGRHVYKNVRRIQGLPPGVSTVKVHYIAAHLHVYGESIELIDMQTGESVFKSVATANEDRTVVEEMTHYTSSEGVELHAGRDYELVSIYNNDTDSEVDAMGVLYIYFANPYFQAARTTVATLR
jgi:hypothetical protein